MTIFPLRLPFWIMTFVPNRFCSRSSTSDQGVRRNSFVPRFFATGENSIIFSVSLTDKAFETTS